MSAGKRMKQLGFAAAAALSAAIVAGCASMPAAAPAPAPAPAPSLAFVLDGFPQAPASRPLPTAALQTIAFASCSNEEWTRDQKAFEQITALKPDLMLFLGDNVYGSDTADDPQLSGLRAAYWQQSRRREFIALAESVPYLAIWDDHDFGKNDAGGDFAGKVLAQAMFDRFWRIGPDSPQAHPEGVYGAYQIGPAGQRVQLILLDTRYHRSPLMPTDQRGAPGKERYLEDPNPANTVLGAAQWAWLEAELKKPADLRLIVSSIQVLALGHGWEKFGNFPTERARMFEVIRRSGAKGVVFLSGDRHYASIAREPASPETVPFALYDFTASAVNMPWTVGPDGVQERAPNRISPAIAQENFGVMRIDWAGRALTLESRDRDGKTLFSQPVPFDEIGL
jgi:alkaline phosphatase D